MFFQRKKDKEVDVASLNEILEIAKRLMHIIYIVTIVVLILLSTSILRELKIFHYIGELLVVISPIFIGIIIAFLIHFALRKEK
jgi:p-aminobenzoyl-glutamate transporter AbgT